MVSVHVLFTPVLLVRNCEHLTKTLRSFYAQREKLGVSVKNVHPIVLLDYSQLPTHQRRVLY